MKKYKLTFLLDKSNNWILPYLQKFIKNHKKKKYKFNISHNYKLIKNEDIVLALGYTRILPVSFLKKNKLNLTIHESALPKNRGFSPIQYQILNNKNLINVSLIELSSAVDSGELLMSLKFKFIGNELYDEIRKIQSEKTFLLIKKFLKIYPNFKKRRQNGKPNYLKKRSPKDSELNINKTLKENFNLMRINNNDRWPSFFKFKKTKYILKIFKG
tara:strand:- start:2391 stop:3035 length:645 start_codon:yes stop_codon:yes gene_type:complete